MQTAEIRRRWLAHFENNGHTVVPSAPLVSQDPSLMFVVAGMVPFIPYLTGQQTPPFQRATSVQKCVRTLDIDEVGKTTRHGTFFQMNGNFSFGDYFKEGAIEYAWDLLTRSQADGGYGLDESRLYATVYTDDDEAAGLWKKVAGLDGDRVVRLGKDENYWDTGQPGPCGPCSEILYDRGPEYGADGDVAGAGDRYLEIWNLVFMQYQRGPGAGKDYEILGDLPSKNIDTGMGLERTAYLLQGVDNIFEIDEVAPVLHRAAELAGTRYGADPQADVRLRVVADHVRAGLMLVGDGVTPSNEGRGYVLRRLLRRAVRSMRLLGVQDASMPELLPLSQELMGRSYPELIERSDRIQQVVYAEEDAFARTLVAGTTILDTAVAKTKAGGGSRMAGDQAFALHDTYGFPIDLTLEMAAEQGVEVDTEGFRELMKAQRDRAKADAAGKRAVRADTRLLTGVLDAFGPTRWRSYETLQTSATVLALLRDAGDVPAVSAGELADVVLDETPFYAESGGQKADAGHLVWDGGRAEVLDVQRPIRGLVVHQVRVLDGELTMGTELEAQVDPEWRVGACQAHSGTHVIHAALRQVLGPQALQSGSFNRPGYLRLDFSWSGGLDATQRRDVEDVANLAIRDDLPVSAAEMTLEQAREVGALALFGETYGDLVRVVEIGGAWSRELCGGTHVSASAQIGTVVLTAESSVGSGTRRVEAVTGVDGFRYLARERDLVTQLSEELKTGREDLPDRVQALVTRLRDADREIAKLKAAQRSGIGEQLAREPRDVFGVRFVGHDAGADVAADELRTLALDVRGRLGDTAPAVVAVAGSPKGRPVVVVATNAEARTWGVSAGALVKVAAQTLGGGGGGKDDVAQGGGTDVGAVGEALRKVEYTVGERVTNR